MSKFPTQIANISFPCFIFNASGVNDEIYPQLKKIAESSSAAITLKSCTKEVRLGNLNPKYIVKSNLIDGCTLNSMGWPNKGLKSSLEFVENLKHEYPNRKIIASLADLSQDECLEMLEVFVEQDLADLLEIDISCPNLEGKAILGYSPEKLELFLNKIKISSKAKIKLGLKMPPYLDMNLLRSIAEVISKFEFITFLTCINTLGNVLIIDPEKQSTIIKPNNGRGGLGGKYLKPIALGNVRSFFEFFRNKMDIIGVGGISSGSDAFEFLLAGACAVQIGSAFAQNGISIFEKINTELVEILERKGYKSIDEAKGKLKFL
jgi:dihydroorotate dehydrogenase (fumarate)